MDDLRDVLEQLHEVRAKWYDLGVSLKLKASDTPMYICKSGMNFKTKSLISLNLALSSIPCPQAMISLAFHPIQVA